MRTAAVSELRRVRSRGRLRGSLALLGPAFVARVAYVDPGNFATNIAAARSTATCCCGSCSRPT